MLAMTATLGTYLMTAAGGRRPRTMLARVLLAFPVH